MKQIALVLACIVSFGSLGQFAVQAGASAQNNLESQRMGDDALADEASRLIYRSRGGSEGLAAAVKQMTELVDSHRDSRLLPLLSATLSQMQEQHATHLLKVATFYRFRRHAPRAAEGKLRQILESYPKYSRLDEVLYQLAMLERETGRREEAATLLQRIVRDYGALPRAKDAQVQLGRRGRVSRGVSSPGTTPN